MEFWMTVDVQPKKHLGCHRRHSGLISSTFLATPGLGFTMGKNRVRYLGLFKVIFYFPNGKSTMWGIYSEYLVFFGNPISKSKEMVVPVGKTRGQPEGILGFCHLGKAADALSMGMEESLGCWEETEVFFSFLSDN